MAYGHCELGSLDAAHLVYPIHRVQNLEILWGEHMNIHLSEKEFLESEIKRLEHNIEVLMDALFKACGDDAQVVEATIDSQGELK